MSEQVTAERRRLAEELHAGIVQQVTALSLAVDSALLHLADGDRDAVAAALHTVRALVDSTMTESRALIDGLRHRPEASRSQVPLDVRRTSGRNA